VSPEQRLALLGGAAIGALWLLNRSNAATAFAPSGPPVRYAPPATVPGRSAVPLPINYPAPVPPPGGQAPGVPVVFIPRPAAPLAPLGVAYAPYRVPPIVSGPAAPVVRLLPPSTG
jgi:hypothetical protein